MFYYIKWLSIIAGAALLFGLGLMSGLKNGTRHGESIAGRTAIITIYEILDSVRPMISEERKADFERVEKLVDESASEPEFSKRMGTILNGLGDIQRKNAVVPSSR